MSECDYAVVGAGILGLAVARELGERRPGARVVVLEREAEVGTHQTGHNSGVIHAGIYYAPGSLKAKLCVEGAARAVRALRAPRRAARALRQGHRGPRRRASCRALDELERRGRANGVQGLRRLDAAGLRELEPHATGVAALHSPNTGIVDFGAVARALAREARGARREHRDRLRGGRRGGARRPGGASATRGGETRAGRAVFCAGAWADRLAVACGAPAGPADRALPRRLPEPQARAPAPGALADLPGARPAPAVPRRAPEPARGRRGAAGPDRAAGGRARRLPPVARAARRRGARRWRGRAAGGCSAAGGAPGSPRSPTPPAAARWCARPRTTCPSCGPGTSSRASPACARRRSGATASSWTTSCSPRPGPALHVRNAPSPAATSALAIARVIAGRLLD